LAWFQPEDLRAFPREVRREMGAVLYAAQQGDTWRAVYTVRFAETVCVLHAFQKKSKRGGATPKQELDLIKRRLAEAERLHRERQN
jgi:phage-related protein